MAGWAYAVARNWEDAHYHHLTGLLTPSEWAGFRANLKVLLQSKPMQDYWAQEQEIFTPRFRAVVEAILDEIQQGGTISRESLLMSGEKTAR